jgi:hypothetical protein
MNVDLETVPGGWIVWHGSQLVGGIQMLSPNEYRCSIKMQRRGKSILQECGRASTKEEAVEVVAKARRDYLRAQRRR